MIDVIFPTFLHFLISSNVQYRAVLFIYITPFQEGSKRGSVVGRWVGRGVGSIITCFKILACLISVNVFGFLFSLFIMGFIIISSSIYIIIIITTIVMVIIFLYTQSK